MEELKANIARLEHTINCGYFSEGYVANCERWLAFYERQLTNLMD